MELKKTKTCPHCGMEIQAAAKKCRYCGKWLDEKSKTSVSSGASKGQEINKNNHSPQTNTLKTSIFSKNKKSIIGITAIFLLAIGGIFAYFYYYNVSDAYRFSEGLAIARNGLNDKYGYINKQGELVIATQYDYVRNFSEGLAAVKINDEWGFINKDGDVIIKPIFECAKSFSEGLAAVEIDGKWGFINKKGDIVIQPRFSDKEVPYEMNETLSFSENLSAARLDGKCVYINKKGEVVLQTEFEEVRNFHNGLAIVFKNKRFNYINPKGKIAFNYKYPNWAVKFSEGLAAVETKEGENGFMDTRGIIIISSKYTRVGNFSEGLAAVEIDGKLGYINKKGEMIISPKYEFPDYYSLYIYQEFNSFDFSDGLARVKLNNSIVFIDKKGEVVLRF